MVFPYSKLKKGSNRYPFFDLRYSRGDIPMILLNRRENNKYLQCLFYSISDLSSYRWYPATGRPAASLAD